MRAIFETMATTPQDPVVRSEQMDLLPRTKRNIRMQYRLAQHTLIPWLQQLGALPPNAAVFGDDIFFDEEEIHMDLKWKNYKCADESI